MAHRGTDTLIRPTATARIAIGLMGTVHTDTPPTAAGTATAPTATVMATSSNPTATPVTATNSSTVINSNTAIRGITTKAIRGTGTITKKVTATTTTIDQTSTCAGQTES